MRVQSSQHQAVLNELVEWWEDISEGGVYSRVVLIEVPRRWGITAVLADFRESVAGVEWPATLNISLDKVLPADRAVEAKALSDALLAPLSEHRLEREEKRFGLDTPAGKMGLALGVGGLFVSGMAVQVSLLLASLGATSVQNTLDMTPTGQQGSLARAARAIAALSAEMPTLVVVDDADRFDPQLAALMIENLISRVGGHVLVAAATHPGSNLTRTLRNPGLYGLAGRVAMGETDPDMSAPARTALARELLPGLPDSALELIGQRTANFAEVFKITSQNRLVDLSADDGSSAVPVVDTVIDAALIRAVPSAEARVLSWAQGVLTSVQVAQALAALGESPSPADDPEVIRRNGLARLRDPASAHIRKQAELLSQSERHDMARAVLQEAIRIMADPEITLIERTAAQLAVHRVRDDLEPSAELTSVQCMLIHGLEQLCDPEAAYQVAVAVRDELPKDAREGPQWTGLLKAWLRLARTRPSQFADPLIDEAIRLATTGGALIGPEARVWAAVNMLGRTGPHDVGLSLVNQVITDLSTYPIQDPTASQWRLLLAFHTGRIGYLATAQHLLAPIINGGTIDQQNAAQAVLRALDGPRADFRLQIIVLENELQDTFETSDDDRLRIHHALARNYGQLGDYARALRHGTDELYFRLRLQKADHPDVLTNRSSIATWTGQSGDARKALQLFQALLPDHVRVLGADHQSTLFTRDAIATWMQESGDIRGALQLFWELLPNVVQILGADHPIALSARASIASLTGQGGDAQRALQLCRELLPDQIRVLGANHRNTLSTRHDAAIWTAARGDSQEALRLSRELLPDLIQVMGADHPNTLSTRGNIAAWTGDSGDAEGALQLFRELLPDQIRILGADHPSTLASRNNLALWTGRCGDARGGFQLFRELLPDLIRVIGADHPNTLSARINIATWTSRCGDISGALQLFRKLLPDLIRVRGASHPSVLAARRSIDSLAARNR